ncbi:hypothetical protein IJG14_09130 [bacterium]|nr:hypothetical protein [bacterium]
MKKFLILIACLCFYVGNAFADTNNTLIASNIPAVSQQITAINNSVVTQPVRASLNQCFDTLSMNSEQLFYLSMAALNNMNYKIKEVQSKTGTILFQAYSREFLITIADKGVNKSFIKILPTDSNYAFSPALVQNIFGFLKANSSVSPVVL